MAPVSDRIRQLVRERARHICEYCHTIELWQSVLFTVDHIIPVTEGGNDDPDNLALACFHCNRYKSNHCTAVDPVTGAMARLFNPRQDHWSEHYVWSSDTTTLYALTATGRATIELLQINRLRLQTIRGADALVGRHPPPGDRIFSVDPD